MTRAGIYCRISSDPDQLHLGVDRQEKDCRGLCEDRGWDVVEVYIDNDTTAADPKRKRLGYQRLLADIQNHHIDAIVVWNEDRLHRQPIELEEFFNVCDAAEVTKMASVGGDIDLSDDFGIFMLRLKGILAAQEIAKIRKRIKRKQLELAEEGRSSGGGRPFGFEKDRITVRTFEAVMIQEAAQRVLMGESLRSIRMDWTDRKVPTVTGKPWSTTMLRSMLTRPRVTGLRQYQGEVIGEAQWPAILDRPIWEQIRVLLTDPSRRQPRPSRDYPLRGVLRCAHCHTYLAAMPRKKKRNYGCRKEYNDGCGHVVIVADHVERYVFDILLPLADAPDLRNTIFEEEQGEAQETSELLLANATDEATLDDLADDRYQKHLITPAEYARQKRAIEKTIEERRNRLATLTGNSALDRLGGQVQERWENMSAVDKRLIILSLVSEIEVSRLQHRGSNVFNPDRIRIIFRYESLSKLVRPWIGADGKFRFWGTMRVDADGMTHGFEGDFKATKKSKDT